MHNVIHDSQFLKSPVMLKINACFFLWLRMSIVISNVISQRFDVTPHLPSKYAVHAVHFQHLDYPEFFHPSLSIRDNKFFREESSLNLSK